MTRRIFHSVFLTAALAILACLFLTAGVLYASFGGEQKAHLADSLELARRGTEAGGMDYLTSLAPDTYRLTWVAGDGTVLFDNREDAAGMENHAEREEIRAALTYGAGESVRESGTRTVRTVYRAVRLSDGSVLRIAAEYTALLPLLLSALRPAALLALLALVLSFFLAKQVARRIVKPINALDTEHPLRNRTYDELSPLLRHMEEQQNRIAGQMAELRLRQTELTAVADSMEEGLVLLSGDGHVLSMNGAAAAFFRVTGDPVGKPFIEMDRTPETEAAQREAQRNGRAEREVTRDARTYRMHISRVSTEHAGGGLVILILDETDRVSAEQSRREFTANVSHELKTPLHTIMGSAELLERGMVKGEDIPRFAAAIRSESARMVALVKDIIHLSQLDEGVSLPREPVDVYAVACEEADALRDQAERRGVTVALTGGTETVCGARQLFSEILHNLIDNAIRYNREGGSVSVSVRGFPDTVSVVVSDSGIGIPPAHQTRVFERFYRVDKSRSRASGGTGLGLSIVKHAVQTLGGTITLESTPGVGSVFTVTFPRVAPATGDEGAEDKPHGGAGGVQNP